MKADTLRAYRTQVTQHVVPFVGRVKQCNLRRAHVAQMMANLAAAGHADTTRATALTRLRQALKLAHLDGMIARNPAEGVTAPAYEPKTDDTPDGGGVRADRSHDHG